MKAAIPLPTKVGSPLVAFLMESKCCKVERNAERSIERLADFLLSHYPDEIGRGNPVKGESAVEVAIRLLARKEGAMERQRPKEVSPEGIRGVLEALERRVDSLGEKVTTLRDRLLPFLASRVLEKSEEVLPSEESLSPLAAFILRQVQRLEAYSDVLDGLIYRLDLSQEGVAWLMDWDKEAR